jgi:hypothetical protein
MLLRWTQVSLYTYQIKKNTLDIHELIKGIYRLTNSTVISLEHDEITNRILKFSEQFIISPLTYICNVILGTGVFPDGLKFAIVSPYFKNGSIQEISNNRLILLLISFSKVIEKLIYTRLITHIEANSILAQEQYGFKTHCSTEMVAFSLICSIIIAVNNKQTVGGIFYDLQKACDCKS